MTTVRSTNIDFGVRLWLEYSNYGLETLMINISVGSLHSYFQEFSYQSWKMLFLEEQKNGRAKSSESFPVTN